MFKNKRKGRNQYEKDESTKIRLFSHQIFILAKDIFFL